MKPINITYEQTPFPSPEAEVEATKLTGGNLQFIRNQISQCMQELAGLQLQQGKEAEYSQAVSYLKGQIAAYSYLITAHTEAYLYNPQSNSE